MTVLTSDPAIAGALAALTLEEKVQLLTGRDFWTTWPIETSDCAASLSRTARLASAVRRGTSAIRRSASRLPPRSRLPGIPDIARRYGAAAAVEARRKGVDVVLGPTINLHRSPLGGRHFEAFSEDLLLTADLAAAYVRGVQDNGVGATPSTTWPTTPKPTVSPWMSGLATAPCASCTCSHLKRPSPRHMPGS